MEVKFEYKLTGAGWAESLISLGRQSHRMTVSDLSDALGHMTKALVHLLNGAEEVEVFFMDEPGEHYWLIHLCEDNRVSIEIQWFEDWVSWGLAEKDSGKVVFAAKVPLWQFAGQVKVALDKIIEGDGIEKYKEDWGEHEFPLKDYQILKQMLSCNTNVVAGDKA